MAHPEGFEPPTARFVAEYSIQLSYGCVFSFSLLVKGCSCFYYLNGASDDFISRLNMAHPEGFEPPTARFVAEYSIQLSYGCVFNFSLLVKGSSCFYYLNGAPDDFILRLNYGASRRIRTSDRSVRSRVLYPAELWMRGFKWR